MERINIRKGLINTFLSVLGKKNSNDMIMILAMIGVDTVLQHVSADERDIYKEIESIKTQLQNLQVNNKTYQSVERSNVEKTATRRQKKPSHKSENTIQRSDRDITPKVNYNKRQSHGRPHLDDNQMKQALYWQPAEEVPKQIKPSVSYFIDIKSMRPIEDIQKVNSSADFNRQIAPVQKPETVKSQPMLRPSMIQPTIQQQKPVTPPAYQQKYEYQPEFQGTHFNPQLKPWRPSPQPQLVPPQTRQNHSPHFNQNQMFRSDAYSKHIHSSEQIIHSPVVESQTSSGQIDQYLQYHQGSQKSSDSNEENVHISRFEPNSPKDNQYALEQQYGLEDSRISANSSAFSLFTPNEEVKNFFQNEFYLKENVLKERVNHQEETENLKVSNLPSQKISNVFVKGRLGGSKIF